VFLFAGRKSRPIRYRRSVEFERPSAHVRWSARCSGTRDFGAGKRLPFQFALFGACLTIATAEKIACLRCRS
jgi:hypothetical protein